VPSADHRLLTAGGKENRSDAERHRPHWLVKSSAWFFCPPSDGSPEQYDDLEAIPDELWMQQMARNPTDEGWGYLYQRRYVLHDRDTKFCPSFRTIRAVGGIKAACAQPQFESLRFILHLILPVQR